MTFSRFMLIVVIYIFGSMGALMASLEKGEEGPSIIRNMIFWPGIIVLRASYDSVKSTPLRKPQ